MLSRLSFLVDFVYNVVIVADRAPSEGGGNQLELRGSRGSLTTEGKNFCYSTPFHDLIKLLVIISSKSQKEVSSARSLNFIN